MLTAIKPEEATTIRPDYYVRFENHEPIKVIRYWGLNFNLGNVVKYIARAGAKDGNDILQELEKAKEYLQFEIDTIKEGRDML